MIYMFIDTEFTCFEKPELISLGLVAVNNPNLYLKNKIEKNEQTFYIEFNDYSPHLCSQFVKDNIIPILTETNKIHSELGSIKIKDWLSSFNEDIVLFADYPGDIFLLKELLKGDMINIKKIEIIERYRENPHHALKDAKMLLEDYETYLNNKE